MDKYEIILDWAAEQQIAWKDADNYGMTAEVIEVDGPAGGNPVIKFTGDSLSNMAMFLLRYSNWDLDEFKLHVENVWRL